MNVFAAEITPKPCPFIVNALGVTPTFPIIALTVAVPPADGFRVKDDPLIIPFDALLSIIDPDETETLP